jgi:ATP-binding cassette subfamily A (ABC1) protein 3
MANGRLRCIGSAQHLKSKFGQGFQVELKVKLAGKDDPDYKLYASSLLQFKGRTDSEEEASDVFFTLNDTISALEALCGDDFLSSMVSSENPLGYSLWRDASSPAGASLDEVAVFATTELRMRKLASFMSECYPNHVLRERQDTKVRYEIDSKDVRLASIFSNIEANKERVMLAEYGVSQTSLEQVFNMHAAQAEELKHGGNDG